DTMLLIALIGGRRGPHDEVSEGLHYRLRRRPWLAIADRPAVDFNDRCDFFRGTRDESLVRSPDIVEGEELFLRLQAEARSELEDGLARHARKVRRRERRHNRMVADDEDVLRARLRHVPVDVEHEGLIGAVLIRLDLGHDVVQVVQGLDGRAEALRGNTPIRGRHDLQAALVDLAEEIDARLRDDDDARTGLAFPRVQAEIPRAAGYD